MPDEWVAYYEERCYRVIAPAYPGFKPAKQESWSTTATATVYRCCSSPELARTKEMTTVRLTHIGGPTVLIEAHGWRLLTDPTFDPPGKKYGFGWGTSSSKTTGPAVPLKEMPPLDAILLSHDHHADNLDDAGRTLLSGAGTVVTTRSGHRRLRSDNSRGLAPWHTTVLTAPDLPALELTATPADTGRR